MRSRKSGCRPAGSVPVPADWWGRSDDTVDGFSGAGGMERAENQVAGFSGGDGRTDGLQVAHFTDEDAIGILAQSAANGISEGRDVVMHFALGDNAVFVLVIEFDGIFDSDDVVPLFLL